MQLCLKNLSNNELLERLHELVTAETEITENVIEHLAEVESRRLYARLGFTSLYDYATRCLGYTGTSANRRILAARALVKQPELSKYLKTGEVSLSSIAACGKALMGDDAAVVIQELRGKSRQEAERLADRYREPADTRDRVTRISSGPEVPRAQGAFEFDLTESYRRCGCEPEEDESFRISFTAGPEFMKKLRRAQELLFQTKAEDTRFEAVLERALDTYLERCDPAERQKRRESRKEAAGNESPDSGAEEAENSTDLQAGPSAEAISNDLRVALEAIERCTQEQMGRSSAGERRVPIPLPLRDAVMKRDHYRCTYVGESGIRCLRRVGLQIDHILPVAKGGKTSMENLRVVCRAHNLQAAREAFGAQFIDKKIAESREKQRKERASN